MKSKLIFKKYTIKLYFALLPAVILLSSLQGVFSQQITTGTLIKEMSNLEKLAEYPLPSYKTVQYSSYDRRSTFPDAPGWFENSDGFGGEPIPGFEKVLKEPRKDGIGEYLICDVEGPGAIVRLWTAAINGNIRLYLDNHTEPVYNGNAFDFFTSTYKAITDKSTGLNGSFIQNMAGYFPIPFVKRCRIIWIGEINALHFYHANIRLYEKGTRVKTFQPEDIQTYSEEIKATHTILTDPDSNYSSQVDETLSFAANVKSDEEKEVLNIIGSKAIACFEMQIFDDNLERALRETILRISFDGASDPQVQSPVGDFFGTAAGLNSYQSLPFTVTEDGKMVCRFYMPFKKSAKISIENLGDREINFAGNVQINDYVWKENKSMYFRARWRVDHDLLASPDQVCDIPFLITKGKGVCVGATVHLMNPTNVPSLWGNWWGEGDEKIFVDDRPLPVFFGTGSEDYFNYAWSSPDIFYHAYCGQPRNDGPGTRGFVTNYRYHILDNIPFEDQFSFYMELLSHEPVPGFSYARIIYHYGLPGMRDDNKIISTGDIRSLSLPQKWYPIGKKGSANSLFYQAEDIVSGSKNTSLSAGRLWAGGQMLVWTPNKKGDDLTLNLPIPEHGRYIIHLTTGLTKKSGSFRPMINGSNLLKDNSTIDLYSEHRTLSRNFEFEEIELTKGLQKLVLASDSQNNLPVGIDFVWIQKIND